MKQIVGDMPVYLTFDIDCLDPAFAPGTGTPVIGGLTSDRAIKLVRGLKDLNIVGMDVVEVAPAYDQSEITALAAATLALEMLYIRRRKGRITPVTPVPYGTGVNQGAGRWARDRRQGAPHTGRYSPHRSRPVPG